MQIFFELMNSDMNPQVGPIAFQGLGSLQVLDLSNNRLGRVIDVIVITILLDNIPKVPNEAFLLLRHLEELHIGRNRISSLSRHGSQVFQLF